MTRYGMMLRFASAVTRVAGDVCILAGLALLVMLALGLRAGKERNRED